MLSMLVNVVDLAWLLVQRRLTGRYSTVPVLMSLANLVQEGLSTQWTTVEAWRLMGTMEIPAVRDIDDPSVNQLD